MRAYCAHLDRVAVRMPPLYPFDYAVRNKGGVLESFVEVKVRDHEHLKYATLTVSATKVATGLQLANSFGMNPVLVVGFNDGIGFVDLNNLNRFQALQMGGRFDRADARDAEPMLAIPITSFHMIPRKA